ncbi:hypothetical protein LOAG_15653 [Loa loa]|uniref:Uncharacterized protein n=1 Tax=Loa loa TaxID=7209 RepID=A0A1S0TFD8_LOALO|nr:hypothetical protein LOAG_15653 [Loa loa]EFO12880.2 hypothetical protein LOAG_15653 [Loa loa]
MNSNDRIGEAEGKRNKVGSADNNNNNNNADDNDDDDDDNDDDDDDSDDNDDDSGDGGIEKKYLPMISIGLHMFM